MLAATRMKMSDSEKEKSEKEHVRHFLLKLKRITRKFLEVSRWSRAKQRQRNVQKKCVARAKLPLLIRPAYCCFHLFTALHAFAA